MSSRCLSNDREIGLAMFALEFLKANLDDEVDEIFLESEFTVGDYPPTEEEIADLMTAIKRPDWPNGPCPACGIPWIARVAASSLETTS